MNEIRVLLGSLGLLLDIIGVIQIFYLKDKFLTNFNYDRFYVRNINQPSSLNKIDGDYIHKMIQKYLDQLAKDINDSTDKIKQENDAILKESQRWLWLIIIGFGLQLLGTLLNLL
jgi:hypothetical protein